MIKAFASWQYNSEMTKLVLDNCLIPEEVLFQLASAIRKLTKFDKLNLHNCALSEDQCSQIIRSLSKCNPLTYLNLSGNKVRNAGKYLAEIIEMWGEDPPLEELYLHNCSIPEDHCSTILQSLHTCIHLKELNMDGNNIGAAGNILAKSIKMWGEDPPLEKLYLDNCSIPEDHCSTILQSLHTCIHLKVLSMDGNGVGTAGNILAKSIKMWGEDPPLEKLYLHNCSIPEDHCSTILQSLHTCIHLKVLSMDGNNIGAAGNILAKSIKMWGEDPPLEKLYLYNCSILEDHCSTILQSLHTCIHLKLWGEDPPLEALYLDNCSILVDIKHEWKWCWCCWKYSCEVYQNVGRGSSFGKIVS